jgi:hypothetical protein
MLCVPWWLLVVIVVGAGALGFIFHFAWHWWLLSRPDVRR